MSGNSQAAIAPLPAGDEQRSLQQAEPRRTGAGLTAIDENEYDKRDRIVRELGYKSYKDYLQSPEWKKIRLRVLKRDHFQCVICKQPARDVHHRRYKAAVLAGGTIGKLVSLCRECHLAIEFSNNGKKLKPLEVDKRFHKESRAGKRLRRKERRLASGVIRARNTRPSPERAIPIASDIRKRILLSPMEMVALARWQYGTERQRKDMLQYGVRS